MTRKMIEFHIRADMAWYMSRTGIVDLDALVEGRITQEMSEPQEYKYDDEDTWMPAWLIDYYEELGFFDMDEDEEDDQ